MPVSKSEMLNPEILWNRYHALVVPPKKKNVSLQVYARASDRNLAFEDELRWALGSNCVAELHWVSARELEQKRKKYGISSLSFEKTPDVNTTMDLTESEGDAGSFLNRILRYAVETRAADIHFEFFEDESQIRMRIDGDLRTIYHLPNLILHSLVNRIKLLARMDIHERFCPQDGRLRQTFGAHVVDFRISSIPTRFGESLVMRVLDKERIFPELKALGMPDDLQSTLHQVAELPSGLFLVTGPTGSGKTTTLYAALQEVHRPEVKILTIEDPVEYELEGWMQVGVDVGVGRTFSQTLRAFLRHDPDKILVGEIRDLETAQIALQAALTGHMVFTTLHTASVSEAVFRLLDLGVERYLLATCLRGILNQRLFRMNCPHCTQKQKVPLEVLKKLPLPYMETFKGCGCAKCGHTGYLGRRALFEYLPVQADMADAMMQGRWEALNPVLSIRKQAEDWLRSGVLSLEEFQQQLGSE